MGMTGLYIELSAGGETARIEGGGGSPLFAEGPGALRGWWGTPDAKVSMTERQTGHGAHAVRDADVLYAARTVTVDLAACGASRASALAAAGLVSRMAGRMARIRVVDGGSDTFCEGYVETSFDGDRLEGAVEGAVTVVCPDPRRYSTAARAAVLHPASGSPGGLDYGAEGAGLAYPLRYGEASGPSANVATVENAGNATAYPVITAYGPFPDGVRVDCGGLVVEYSAPVGDVPLVLDCASRTASVGGVDASRALSSRSFPSVPPASSATLVLSSSGGGWVSVESRDTYI